ncbi:MAG: tetratricopeptide repeat protein, partial [Vicingaceae bacterium]|nr:tetratricopeptide repeat protein [Vicingaceae bacterium]
MIRSCFTILFFGLFLIITNLSFGQIAVIDSLEKQIETEVIVGEKVKLLNKLCEQYQSSDYKKSLKHAKEALALSEQISKKNKAKKALISQSANNVGAGYLLLDNYEKSQKYLLMALKIAEEIKDTSRMSNAAYNLGLVYDYKGNKALALKYVERSIELDEKSGDLEAAVYGYSSLSADYFFDHEYNKGMVYYAKAMKIIDEINKPGLKAVLYENRAVGLKYENRYIEALKYHEKAIAIDIKLNNTASLETNYLNVADLYMVMNNNKKAIEYNNKSLEIALKLKSIKTIMKAYSGLAESYEQMGKTDLAYKNILLYANWKDSLYRQENATVMAEMQTKYETDKKEAENTLLVAENELDKAELDKKSIQQKMLLTLLGLVTF